MAVNNSTTGGKKNKKKAQVKLSWQEFVGTSATSAPVVSKPAYSSWAEEMEDQNVDEEPDYKLQINRAALPTAPRAARCADVDESKVPNEPPFNVFIGNLPFEVQPEDIRKFFKNLTVVDIRLQTDGMGRMKGFGHVEFQTREMLLEALSFSDLHIKSRAIKVDLASHSQDKERREGMQQQHRGNKDEGDDKTLGDWRKKADRLSNEQLNRRDDYDRDNDRFDRNNEQQQRGNRYNNRSNYNDRSDDRSFDRGNKGGYREKYGSNRDNRDRYFRDDKSDNNNRFRGSNERDSNAFERGRREDRHSSNKDEPMDWRQAPKIELPPPRRGGREGGSRDASGENWKRDTSGGSRGARYGRDEEREGGKFGRDAARFSRDEMRRSGRNDQNHGSFKEAGAQKDSLKDENRSHAQSTDNVANNTSVEITQPAPSGPKERPKLNLKPRSKPLNEAPDVVTSTIFGAAKPVDTTQREREIEEKLKQMNKPLDGDSKRQSQSSNQDESSRRQLSSNDSRQKKDLKQSSSTSVQQPRGRRTTESSEEHQSVESSSQPAAADKQQQPTPPVKMVPAPPPKVNAWTARRTTQQEQVNAPTTATAAPPTATTSPAITTSTTSAEVEEVTDDVDVNVNKADEATVDDRKQQTVEEQPESDATSSDWRSHSAWQSQTKDTKPNNRGGYSSHPIDRRQPSSQYQQQHQQQPSRRTAVSVGHAMKGGAGNWGRSSRGGGVRKGEFDGPNLAVVSVRQAQQQARKEKHVPTSIDDMPKLEDHSRKDWSNKNKFSSLMNDNDDEDDDADDDEDAKKSIEDEQDDGIGDKDVDDDGDDGGCERETMSDFSKKSELQECV
ncbi:hypothetical protein HELRODRAFT_194085 [Helobdella robusta]|uniref:RRM domain-containing protein n=1 Tax=Helobdella robusta TaxID=6412 RepID=T1FVN5_HELRO|nr:hypothetical protein HELRODRAFT_194085 [Helobdella robusta]ESN93405.1 hypothetical protein HELRODRAFT_194085 [Helobdella robusta]